MIEKQVIEVLQIADQAAYRSVLKLSKHLYKTSSNQGPILSVFKI